MIGHFVLLHAVFIAAAVAGWLALIFAMPEPQRREDGEWHGRNAPAVPPPIPVLPRHVATPPAADAPVR